jgi:hypothetical protein
LISNAVVIDSCAIRRARARVPSANTADGKTFADHVQLGGGLRVQRIASDQQFLREPRAELPRMGKVLHAAHSEPGYRPRRWTTIIRTLALLTRSRGAKSGVTRSIA